MDEAATIYLKKTVFWQRFAAVVLTTFLAVMWGMCIYYFITDVMRDPFAGRNREIYYIFAIFFTYLGVGSYLDFILFQASTSLNRYLNFNDMSQLEIAFRKQRHFWMGLTLMILSVFLVSLLFAIAVSTFT